MKPKLFIQEQISFRHEGKTKTFLDEDKLRKCVICRLPSKKWLKEVFETEKMAKEGI